jgi:telomerase reverse transcriptase
MGKKRKRPGKENNGGITPKRSRIHSAECHTHPVLSQYYPRLVTLRQYLLEQLPSSFKARRRRIASLNANVPLNLDPHNQSIDHDSIIANLLDSTLVGVLKESNQSIDHARQRDFAAFTQSEERSLLCTDTGPTSPQSEVSPIRSL